MSILNSNLKNYTQKIWHIASGRPTLLKDFKQNLKKHKAKKLIIIPQTDKILIHHISNSKVFGENKHMQCKICKSKKIIKINNLNNQPISSVFLEKRTNNLKKYNINLYECSACKLIQFAKLPPLGEMYGSTYGYRTSLSKLMVNHMKKKFNKFIKLDNLKKDSNILDIGSNDGTFLNFFSKLNKKLNLYGIDPSAFKFKNTITIK